MKSKKLFWMIYYFVPTLQIKFCEQRLVGSLCFLQQKMHKIWFVCCNGRFVSNVNFRQMKLDILPSMNPTAEHWNVWPGLENCICNSLFSISHNYHIFWFSYLWNKFCYSRIVCNLSIWSMNIRGITGISSNSVCL